MATANSPTSIGPDWPQTSPWPSDWPFSNPWLWMIVGLLGCSSALLWVRLFADAATPVRFTLMLLGLAGAAVAIILRMNSAQGAFLDKLGSRARALALISLSGFGVLIVLLALGLLAAGLVNWDEALPWSNASLVFVCILVVPGGAMLAGYFLLRERDHHLISKQAETAALLVCAAVCTFFSCWALFIDVAHEQQWDTMRLFLAMVSAFIFLAAPMVLLPRRIAYVVLSALFVYHLGGIVNAAASAPPSPWIASRTWTYLYRPYLEFMYLNNAYHFYAPEPGPSGYLEYRVLYERPDKSQHWRWGRVPETDEKGYPNYLLSIQYQRRIAMIETLNRTDNPPSEFIYNAKYNRFMTHPIYFWRRVNSPNPPEQMIGQPRVTPQHVIPFHPDLAALNQYKPSAFLTRMLMETFARHLAELRPGAEPGDKFVNVKLYRIIHVIPPPELVLRDKLVKSDRPVPRFNPQSPEQYLPFFQGTFDDKGTHLDMPIYDSDGNLLNKGDPFLYWLVPVLKDNPNVVSTPIRDYMRLHAGDRKWVLYPDSPDYVEPSDR